MKRRPRHRPRPWYVSSFGADYLSRYPHRSDAEAAAEIPFVCRVLGLSAGSLVLDLCCGAGRHSRALSQYGFRVLGLDLSPELLRVAQKESSALRSVRFVRGDMRYLPVAAASLDGAINLFTSFGYFPTDAENAQVLHEVARVLKPGAPFVLDYFNLKTTVDELVPVSHRKLGPAKIIERRRFDEKQRRVVKETRVTAGSVSERRIESVRGYEYSELLMLFKDARLNVDEVFGDLAGAAYDERTSPRLVLVARRKKGSR